MFTGTFHMLLEENLSTHCNRMVRLVALQDLLIEIVLLATLSSSLSRSNRTPGI
jgi:hypothetical protein